MDAINKALKKLKQLIWEAFGLVINKLSKGYNYNEVKNTRKVKSAIMAVEFVEGSCDKYSEYNLRLLEYHIAQLCI